MGRHTARLRRIIKPRHKVGISISNGRDAQFNERHRRYRDDVIDSGGRQRAFAQET